MLYLLRVTIDNKSWVTRLPDVLLIEFEHQPSDTSDLLNNIRKPGGKLRIYLISIMQSAIISRIVIVLLYLHSLCFLIYEYENKDLELVVQCVRAVITFVFIVEALARILGLGLQYLARSDYVDIMLVVVGGLANLIWFYFNWKGLYIYKGICVVVASVSFMARLAVNSAQVKNIVQLIMQVSSFFYFLLNRNFVIRDVSKYQKHLKPVLITSPRTLLRLSLLWQI